MAWIQVNDTLREHRKTYALANALNIEDYAAVGLTVCLWTWALTNAETGNLSVFPPRAVARACGWQGDASALLDALVASGFLDADYRIHDWDEYAGRLIEKRESSRERMRTQRRTQKEKTQVFNESLPTPVRSTFDERSANVQETLCERSAPTVEYTVQYIDNIRSSGSSSPDCDHDGDPNADLRSLEEAQTAVFDAAKHAGFPDAPSDLDRLNGFIADYGAAWVLEAISRTADAGAGARNWRYLRGILSDWKRKGGVDMPGKPRAAPVAVDAKDDKAYIKNLTKGRHTA